MNAISELEQGRIPIEVEHIEEFQYARVVYPENTVVIPATDYRDQLQTQIYNQNKWKGKQVQIIRRVDQQRDRQHGRYGNTKINMQTVRQQTKQIKKYIYGDGIQYSEMTCSSYKFTTDGDYCYKGTDKQVARGTNTRFDLR